MRFHPFRIIPPMIDSSAAEPDYYALLGVAPDATTAEIERAYREQAEKRLNARWRRRRAARELALLNAAYGVLAYPERRAEYDRRRAERAARGEDEPNGLAPVEPESLAPLGLEPSRPTLPRVRLGRSTGSSLADAVAIILVVTLALVVAVEVASRWTINLSVVQTIGTTLGLGSRPRTPAVVPTASPTAAEVVPSPVPTGPPPTPPGALPTTVASQRFAGSEVVLSSTRPARGSELTVTLKLMRDGQPIANANVYLVAHYRTVDERQPPGTSTVRTDSSGTAVIRFNIGNATPDYTVPVDVTALVDGQQVVFQTSFTPQ